MKSQVFIGLALALSVAGAARLQAQDTAEKASPRGSASDSNAATPAPAGITPELIAQGNKVFHGPGNCYACHGTNGEGAVGPNLTDAEWLHSKGSFEDIVAQVTNGVPKEDSKTGIPMPAKGGGSISDDDVKAVAAYVYSLSHK
jgi:mono/diheme cytochrome c family protein